MRARPLSVFTKSHRNEVDGKSDGSGVISETSCVARVFWREEILEAGNCHSRVHGWSDASSECTDCEARRAAAPIHRDTFLNVDPVCIVRCYKIALIFYFILIIYYACQMFFVISSPDLRHHEVRTQWTGLMWLIYFTSVFSHTARAWIGSIFYDYDWSQSQWLKNRLVDFLQR